MEHIKSLGHTYVLRLKKNLKVLHQGKKDKEKVWKSLSDLSKYKFHSAHYNEIELTENKYTTNIVISDSVDTDTAWILATNSNYKRAIKDYSYRFGGIETVFKNQKSNGFYIEDTVNCSLKYFHVFLALVFYFLPLWELLSKILELIENSKLLPILSLMVKNQE